MKVAFLDALFICIHVVPSFLINNFNSNLYKCFIIPNKVKVKENPNLLSTFYK